MYMDISKFLSNSEDVKAWLDQQKSILEDRDAYLSYWFHNKGVGVSLTKDLCGEFHIMKNGTYSVHVESADGVSLYEHSSKTNDSQVIKNTFTNFQKRVCNEDI